MKKRLKSLHWDWWIVLIFLIIRLVINLEIKTPSIIFAIIYAIFIILLSMKTKYFITSLVTFLIIDSAIGTYLLVNNILPLGLYLGTILVNLAIIIILVKNNYKIFKK